MKATSKANAAENAVLDELADTWMARVDRVAPVSGKRAKLIPFTLLKAALSSHLALAETVRNRRRTLASLAGGNLSPGQQKEDDALERLGALGVVAASSAADVGLTTRLASLGWDARSVHDWTVEALLESITSRME